MRVQELMTVDPRCAGSGTNAAELAEIFWERDCGIVPIVDDESRVIGVVTDRDVAIGLGTRDRRASEVTAGDLMSADVATCTPDEDVSAALARMQARRVARLPVVEADRRVVGILSLGDFARRAAGRRDVPWDVVLAALGAPPRRQAEVAGKARAVAAHRA